jgi:hypothetical protein
VESRSVDEDQADIHFTRKIGEVQKKIQFFHANHLRNLPRILMGSACLATIKPSTPDGRNR